MESKTYFRTKIDAQRFISVLSSAAFEWLLILMLFLNAWFSFLVTKFARFCKLQTPCLLCSRLDHILGCEKPGFYWNLICRAHKLEISSLAYCHKHKKLSDVHQMCEGCLISYATEKKSNSETYRSLVGKLGADRQVDINADDVVNLPLLHGDQGDSPCTRHCLCCGELINRKSHYGLPQTKSIGVEVSDLDVPLSGDKHPYNSDGLRKRREKPLESPRVAFPLSHIGYSELKITSDSESEKSFSDEDNRGAQLLKQEDVSSTSNIIPKTLAKETDKDKLIHPPPVPRPPISCKARQFNIDEPSLVSSSGSSTAVVGHGLEELTWDQVEKTSYPLVSSDFISVHAIPSTDVKFMETPDETLNAKDVGETGDVSIISTSAMEEVVKAVGQHPATGRSTESRIIIDPNQSMSNFIDLNDAYKLAVGSKGNQASNTTVELFPGRDSSKVHEDLKQLISQISTARGFDFIWNDMSPRVNAQSLSPSSSTGAQLLLKRLSIDRNESGLESLEGSIVSEIEGESAVDRLKRQIELDRKSMSALYKELEEERNASAIAANQAMAMITRLQEEKASMQMEALQYQRMMDEQAEYDQEALQNLNDILAQKEKELQDMEAEFERYKKIVKIVDDNASPSSFELDKKSEDDSKPDQKDMVFCDSNGCKVGAPTDPLSDFESEKSYISTCLKELERRLFLFSNNGVCETSGVIERHDWTSLKNGSNKEMYHNELLLEECQTEGTYYLEPHDKARSVLSEGNHESLKSNDRQNFLKLRREGDLVTIENEVSQLNKRLGALEADKNFLEHTINSLRNGSEGIQFVQEIECHLRELRRIGIDRDQLVD
ncbi:hypothetical protein QJS10_CPA08g00176 [Acorus calamus]|uniref:GTD-binding domain-containing protein n=1 Tax=Acorus calamus TaxID=4465 RepID=A0AAV9EBI9_ACOCL|nr:hypothetical protein QJS10_CPA08g00176 [Acorus calamus]